MTNAHSHEKEAGNKHFIAIRLENDEANKCLTANIVESENATEVSLEYLQSLLEDETYEAFSVSDEQLEDLLHKASNQEFGTTLLQSLTPQFVAMRFEFDDEKTCLSAVLEESYESSILTKSLIVNKMRESGFEQLYVEENAIESLIEAFKKRSFGIYQLAEKKDAQIEISISNDGLEAKITTTKAYGGLDISKDSLLNALHEAGVDDVYILQNILSQVVERQEVKDLKIAEGIAAEHGEDGDFKALVDEYFYPDLEETDTGKIDLNEFRQFTQIEPGTPVMEYSPATPGKDGCAVTGDVIKASHGEEKKYNKDLPGTEVCKDNQFLLIASSAGHPQILQDGVKIEQVLKVKQLDATIGHIRFDGSLMVDGDITAAIIVDVTGDIIVKGVVNGAQLNAGRDIIVNAGIVGTESQDAPKEIDHHIEETIFAGGNICAKYVSLSRLRALGNIDIKEYISHSVTYAEKMLLLGQDGGKGNLLGGYAHGAEGVAINLLGADSAVRTIVSTGKEPKEPNQLAILESEQKKELLALKDIAATRQILTEKSKGAPSCNDTKNTLTEINEKAIDAIRKIETLKRKISQLKTATTDTNSTSISVVKTVFPNCKIIINGATLEIRMEGKGGEFYEANNELHWKQP